jgi:hypothetical protein
MHLPGSNITKEDLQAEIDKIKKNTQKKIDKLWRQAHFEISDYEAQIECFAIIGHMGFCHSYWPARKRILKEKYNIDWQTPAEKDPWIIYD